MFEVQQTDEFEAWLDGMRDRRAQSVILQRIVRIEAGLLGAVRLIGDGVSELKVDYGPGYRLYFTKRRGRVIWLLIGGDKSDQRRDIRVAKALAAGLED